MERMRHRHKGMDTKEDKERCGVDGGNGMNVFAEEYTLILGICQSLKSLPQEGSHPRLGSPTDSG